MSSSRVALPIDHPGVTDDGYLARRNEIAAASIGGSSESSPAIVYTPAEDDVWRTVSAALSPLHAEYAVDEYRAGVVALSLPADRVPQLSWVSERLDALTGWRVRAVPGLVPIRTFYGSLSERTFLSTQYVRHPSVPFYTPEPDVIHEMIGHANALASPRLAALYEAAGRASLRASTDAQMEELSRVFWFTLEFGVAWEAGQLRTYGAGLLSSFGEIQSFRASALESFDPAAMSRRTYDITAFQDVLFAADSFADAERSLHDYLDRFGR
ncbi:MAG: phenylalanine 4-monooxygenase [Ilumatobacteraceae bacterium]|nr:phenylalanine 4-monooxygenase [Ilumatobacteraceae bacterium]